MDVLDSHFILSATLKFLQVTFRISKLIQIVVKFETLKSVFIHIDSQRALKVVLEILISNFKSAYPKLFMIDKLNMSIYKDDKVFKMRIYCLPHGQRSPRRLHIRLLLYDIFPNLF